MKSSWALLLGVIALPVIAEPSARAAVLGSIQSVDFPGAQSGTTMPYAINNSGEIAGVYLDPAIGFRVFMLTGGSYASVDPAGSVNGSNFVSLNNAGQIAGFSNTATPPSFGNYYLASNGTFAAFPPASANIPAGASFSFYNDNGAVAGQTATTAFISQNGVIQTIAPPTTTSTTINAINNAGEAVGGFFPAMMPSPTANEAAFLYDNGTYMTLDPPGSTFTEALGINDAGVVVGDFQAAMIIGPGGVPVTPVIGFTYANGVYTDYSVPGAYSTQLFGINDAGQVVGYYNSSADTSGQGFVATIGATAVPEPASLLLIVTSLLGLGMTRRCRNVA